MDGMKQVRLRFGAEEVGVEAKRTGHRLAAGLDPVNPCWHCSFDDGRPQVHTCGNAATARALVVGEALWKDEVRAGVNFVGPAGEKLRRALARFGLGRDQIATGNVVSCQPNQINADDPAFRTAAEHCIYHLRARLLDLVPQTPLLLLGGVAVSWLWPLRPGETASAISEVRGLRRPGAGRTVFAAFHPSYVLRAEGDAEGPICRRWLRDLERFADYALGRERMPEERFEIARTERRARVMAKRLAYGEEIWAVDLETVGVDPRAEDAAVLSAAFSWADGEACGWGVAHPETPYSAAVGLALLKEVMEAIRPRKVAQFGTFEADWSMTHAGVRFVPNYVGDPYLASFLRNPVKRWHAHSLERLVTDVLGGVYHWGGTDKKRMREYPLKDVLWGSMRDAEATLRLATHFRRTMTDETFYFAE